MFNDLKTSQEATQYFSCLKGRQMLQEPQYRNIWRNFREHIPLGDFDFEQYYTATVCVFAEYVQLVPATRHVYYSQPGGLFQLGLDRAVLSTKLALKAFQDFDGKTPDQLTAFEQAELFAVFSAALLSDIGLLTQRYKFAMLDAAEMLRSYDPYLGSMLQQGKKYAFEFTSLERGDWSGPASLVLASRLLSQTNDDYRDSGFAWISRHHDILQLWYEMMLELTPTGEGTTRRRYLISLIPFVDSNLIQDFLLNIHDSGLLLPARQQRAFFTPTEIEESLEQANRHHDFEGDDKDASRQTKREFEKVFGGMGAADATNSQVLGSLGAALAPQLRYGLAFLGWLMNLARAGRLWTGDGQAALAFGMGGGQIVFDIQRLIQEFAKTKGMPKISAQELINALKEIQVLKSQNLNLRKFELNNGASVTKFDGMVLPASFVLGDQPGPKVNLGLKEIAVQAVAVTKEALKETIKASAFAIFRHRPLL
ncbi:MAG: hypothetical protein K0S08_1200 [Gammaproteobacteria bacterium]|jgi:hypothetical protein|nr:hypothetical protein [Gammaproteobacteria bacterium]